MSNKITRLAVFPVLYKEGWFFRVSVSDSHNIMLIAMRKDEPTQFMMRYFTDEESAVSWIDECAAGKHQDEL